MDVIGQLHDPAALTPGKAPPNPLDRRLGGPQIRSGRGDEKNSCPCRESNPGRPARSLVNVVSELSRLLGSHTRHVYVISYKHGDNAKLLCYMSQT